MSWWKLASPEPDPRKVAREASMDRDVSTALRDLRRAIYSAHVSREFHFEPILAEVNDALRNMGK